MPDGFFIGPLHIRFYGIIIMLGALAAAWLATRLAKRKGEDPEIVWDMLIWALIGGIVGARIWHILTPPASMVAQGITTYYYLTHPLDAINTTAGGLGIPGAVIGGGLAVYIFCRNKRISFARWVDIVAPGLAMAQAIGRLGNFVNQEVYGLPTNLPWAIYIDPAHRQPGYMDQAYYHPLFAYEAIWNLLNMGFLLWISRKFASRLRDGDVFLIYLIIYPAFRFFLEYLRLDPSPVGGIDINQMVMAVVVVVAAGLLIYRHRKPAPEIQEVEPEAEEVLPEEETK